MLPSLLRMGAARHPAAADAASEDGHAALGSAA
jgi:hypothetical protein